jgi:nitrate reductase delta subunit
VISTPHEKLKILSFLLQFPDDQMLADLSAAKGQIAAAFDGQEREKIDNVVQHLQQTPMLELQETFSNLFDLNPSTCLNLTYHRFGDDKERGQVLARYAQAYSDAGYVLALPELPDYLPMILELVSQDNAGDNQWMLLENSNGIAAISERLDADDSPYAGLFEILARMLGTGDNSAPEET